VAYEIYAERNDGVRRHPQHGGPAAQAPLYRNARRRALQARAAGGVVRINTTPQTESEHVHLWCTVSVPVESRVDHQRLKDSLTNYIWEMRGEKAGRRIDKRHR
jgi:hypothetical protein